MCVYIYITIYIFLVTYNIPFVFLMERNRNGSAKDNSNSKSKGNERMFYRNTDPHDKAVKLISHVATDKVVSPFTCVSDNSDNIFNGNNYEIIEPKPFNSTSNNNSNTCDKSFPFVEAILINGLSPSNTTFIPNSLLFPSSCNHKECSILPALSPHLLQVRNSSFTNANSSLNINANFDCVSFPLGIKLCYKYTPSQPQLFPKNDDMYFNIIHDTKGNPHYIVSFTYYIIHSTSEFKQQFKVDPITEYTIQLSNNVSIYNDETIQRNFNTLSDFVLNETVLVPESVSLVSQFPYINQLKTCIKQMIAIKHDKVDDVIEHILNQVRLIVSDYQFGVMFYLPKSSTPIELLSLCTLNEQNPNTNDISEINYSVLFGYLSVKQIIYIFNLLLLEKSILFISKDNKRLSETMLILLNMMYPLQWKHTFSPVLNCYITLSLQSPTPFIFGMHPQLLALAMQNNEIQTESTFLINLDNDTRFHYANPHVDELPLSLYDIVHKELDKVRRSCKGELNINSVNERMTNAFTKGLVVVLGEYKRFVFYTENYAVPFIDKSGFIEYVKGQVFYKESKYVKLIEDVLNTQNFMQFLLTQKDNFFDSKEYFNNVNEQFVKEIQDKQIRKTKRSATLRAYSLTKLKDKIDNNGNISELKCPFSKLNHKHKVNNNITRLYILYPYFLPAVPNDLSINKKIIENLISRKLTREKQTDITNDKEPISYITSKPQNKFNNISSTNTTSSKLKYTYPLTSIPHSSHSSSSNNNNNNNTFFPFEIDSTDKNALFVFFKDIFIHKTLPENTQDIINSYFNEDNQIEQQHITINDSCIVESNINGIIYKLHFCKYLIYNIQLYSDNQCKLITLSQFDVLFKINRNCLLMKIDDKDLCNRDCFLMYKGYTITLFVYYKMVYDNKKKANAYFMFQEFKKCNIKCDVWFNTKFWEMFVIDEVDKRNIRGNCNEILKLVKDVCTLMIKLELKSVIIKNSLLSTFSKELLLHDNDKYIQLEDFVLNEVNMSNNNNIYI